MNRAYFFPSKINVYTFEMTVKCCRAKCLLFKIYDLFMFQEKITTSCLDLNSCVPSSPAQCIRHVKMWKWKSINFSSIFLVCWWWKNRFVICRINNNDEKKYLSGVRFGSTFVVIICEWEIWCHNELSIVDFQD